MIIAVFVGGICFGLLIAYALTYLVEVDDDE